MLVRFWSYNPTDIRTYDEYDRHWTINWTELLQPPLHWPTSSSTFDLPPEKSCRGGADLQTPARHREAEGRFRLRRSSRFVNSPSWQPHYHPDCLACTARGRGGNLCQKAWRHWQTSYRCVLQVVDAGVGCVGIIGGQHGWLSGRMHETLWWLPPWPYVGHEMSLRSSYPLLKLAKEQM